MGVSGGSETVAACWAAITFGRNAPLTAVGIATPVDTSETSDGVRICPPNPPPSNPPMKLVDRSIEVSPEPRKSVVSATTRHP